MSQLEDLARERRDLVRTMEQLVGNATTSGREMSPEEYRRFNSLKNRVASIDSEGEALAGGAPELKRYGLEERPGDVTSASGERRLSGPFGSSGEFFKAVVRAGTPGGQTDPRLFESRAATGMNETVGSEGGFLVQSSLASELLRGVVAKSNLLSRCRRWPLGPNSNGIKLPRNEETSRVTGSRLGGVVGYWGSEASQTTASKPKFGTLELNLKRLSALTYVTDELLSDSVLLAAFLETAFTEELAYLADEAVYKGTGAGQPLGILNSDALIEVAKTASQPNTTFSYENATSMFARLPAGLAAGAAWFINQDVMPQLLQMVVPVHNLDGDDVVGGSAAYLPAGGASASPYGTLLGLPVIAIEQAATLGAKGDVLLANLGAYSYISKDVQQASSIHVQFIFSETAFRWTLRIDGAPSWKSAVVPASGSANTISPFVCLAARTS